MARQGGRNVACSVVIMIGFGNTLLAWMQIDRETRPDGMTPHTSSPTLKLCLFSSGRCVTFPTTNTQSFGLVMSLRFSDGIQQCSTSKVSSDCEGFETLWSRRQIFPDKGIVDMQNEFLCSLLLSFTVFLSCTFALIRRFINRLPSLKATSSSLLSHTISLTNKSTSDMFFLEQRSTAVTLTLNSSRLAVLRRPQTVEPQGIDVASEDLLQESKV